MKLTEKTLSQNYQYRGRIINLRIDQVELPNGKTAQREVIEHPGGVCVAALTEQEELLMVRQYRYPYEKVLYEIPAGKLEYGEDPELCGRRELLEETGAAAEEFTLIGQMYPTPGYCGEVIHIYFARGLTYDKMKLDDDEFLECEKIPVRQALDMVMNGEIPDAKTQIAVLKTARMLNI